MKILKIEANNVNEFEKIIKEMPAFVKIFRPDCGHCIEMAPAWKALENRKDLQHLHFALVAINSNAISAMKSPGVKSFNGVPTVREIKQGSGKAGKEYNGNRSEEDMTKFIKNTFRPKNNRKTKRGGNCGCNQTGGRKRTIKKSKSKTNRSIKKRSRHTVKK